MKRQQSKGFTLIELIMVIVILGILSAFALPRFADFGDSARQSAIDGLRGAVASASGVTRSAYLVNGFDENTTDEVTLDGTAIKVTSDGYATAAADGIQRAANISSADIASFIGDGTDSNYFIIASSEATSEEDRCFFYNEDDGSVSSIGEFDDEENCEAEINGTTVTVTTS